MTFETPDDLYYAESHEWYDPDSGRIGITDFAQDELGDIVFVELPETGSHLEPEESFGIVESIKAVSDVYAPIEGDVAAVNEDLADAPELVNDDPFGDGWLLELEDTPDDVDGLLTPDEYRAHIE